jgi:hypothetical protein
MKKRDGKADINPAGPKNRKDMLYGVSESPDLAQTIGLVE